LAEIQTRAAKKKSSVEELAKLAEQRKAVE